MSIEAMKQARDFISRLKFADAEPEPEIVMAVLDQAIAEAEKQEPVAWIKRSAKGNIIDLLNEPDDGAEPIYTHPPKRQWVGLMDEEINEWTPEIHAVIRAIEAKLKEKNHDTR